MKFFNHVAYALAVKNSALSGEPFPEKFNEVELFDDAGFVWKLYSFQRVELCRYEETLDSVDLIDILATNDLARTPKGYSVPPEIGATIRELYAEGFDPYTTYELTNGVLTVTSPQRRESVSYNWVEIILWSNCDDFISIEDGFMVRIPQYMINIIQNSACDVTANCGVLNLAVGDVIECSVRDCARVEAPICGLITHTPTQKIVGIAVNVPEIGWVALASTEVYNIKLVRKADQNVENGVSN